MRTQAEHSGVTMVRECGCEKQVHERVCVPDCMPADFFSTSKSERAWSCNFRTIQYFAGNLSRCVIPK